jgi:hypothetical protein
VIIRLKPISKAAYLAATSSDQKWPRVRRMNPADTTKANVYVRSECSNGRKRQDALVPDGWHGLGIMCRHHWGDRMVLSLSSG